MRGAALEKLHGASGACDRKATDGEGLALGQIRPLLVSGYLRSEEQSVPPRAWPSRRAEIRVGSLILRFSTFQEGVKKN